MIIVFKFYHFLFYKSIFIWFSRFYILNFLVDFLYILLYNYSYNKF
nr:MAG TPA: hypothetical protein [Caudoviricetes sp.]